MEILIRPARVEDANDLTLIATTSIQTLCAQVYTPEQIEMLVDNYSNIEFYSQGIETKLMDIFVAQTQAKIIGFASLWGKAIGDLFVHPLYIHQGVGTLLVNAIEQKALQKKIFKLKVMSSLNAHTFYLSRGYQVLEPSFLVDANTDIKIPCVELVKLLFKTTVTTKTNESKIF